MDYYCKGTKEDEHEGHYDDEPGYLVYNGVAVKFIREMDLKRFTTNSRIEVSREDFDKMVAGYHG